MTVGTAGLTEQTKEASGLMKVKWLGHSCFLLTSNSGTRVILDPYKAGNGLNYGEVAESADVVLISHEHGDHNNPGVIKGNPAVIKGPGTRQVKGISFKGTASFHDEAKGAKRGANTIFTFEIDGVKVCHVGDLGHDLSEAEIKELGKVDILFLPVGGFYTCAPTEAATVADKIAPKVIIPMHYRTSKVDTAQFGAICGVDEFLNGKTAVDRRDSSEAEFEAGQLPSSTMIVVLKPAL